MCRSKNSLGFYTRLEKERFKCFACGQQGGAFDFEKALGQTQEEAIEKLHSYHGIPQEKKPTTKPMYSWPTKSEILAKIEPIEDCIKWAENRNFGEYNQESAEILEKCLLGKVSFPWYGQEKNYFVVPVYKAPDEIQTVQLLGFPKVVEGKLKTEKVFPRKETDQDSAKGYLPIFPKNPLTEAIFLVESVTNALVLAASGLKAIAIFSVSNRDMAKKLKEIYPKETLVFWLDKGKPKKELKEGVLTIEEMQKEAMSKYDLPGIFWRKNLPSGYDHNDLIREKNFVEELFYYLDQLPQSLPVPQEENDLEKALSYQEKNLNLILGGTGIGKTKLIEKLGMSHIKRQEPMTIFTDTVQNATSISSDMNAKELALVISHGQAAISSGQKQYNVSTYGYLGFKGHYPYIYAEAGHKDTKKGLTTNKILYMDEFHQLFETSRIHYPLCACYVERQTDGRKYYSRIEDFQHWQKYRFAYWPTRMDFNKFEYLKKILESGESEFSNKSKAFAGRPVTDYQDPSIYQQINGTLFGIDIETTIDTTIPIVEHGKKYTEHDFLDTLLKKTYKARVICEFPILKSTKQPLNQKQVNDLFLQYYQEGEEKATEKARAKVNSLVTFPKNCAYLPILTGYNLLPLMQCLAYGYSINAFTATLSDRQIVMLREAISLCGWTLSIKKINMIPFKFNVDVLKQRERLDCAQQSKILDKLIEKDAPKSLWVIWKMSNAEQIHENMKFLNPNRARGVCFFKQKYYKGIHLDLEYASSSRENSEKHIVTYSGAAILQGENMPNHQIAVIDCGIFIAKAFLELMIGATQEEVKRELMDFIQQEILQITGRIFRPFTEEWNTWNKTTQVSKKKIVLLLHNLPEEIKDFKLNQELIADYNELTDSEDYRFFSLLPDTEIQSYAQAIMDVLQDRIPVNYKEIDAQRLVEQDKNREHLSHKQRKGLGDDLKATREEKKIESLKSKIVELKKQGITWREIFTRLHLSRKSQETRDLLRIFYESH